MVFQAVQDSEEGKMALDPRLSLMGNVPDVNRFFKGAELGQNLMNMPLQNELLQQKVQAGQNQLDQAPILNQLNQQKVAQNENTLTTQQQGIDKGNLEREIFGARKLVSAIGRGDEQGAINTIIETFPDKAKQDQEIAELRADPIGYGRDAQGGIDAFDAQEGRIKTTEKLPAIQQNLEAAGFVRGTPSYQAKLLEIMTQNKAPGVTVNLGSGGDKTFQEALGKSQAKEFTTITEQADSAGEANDLLSIQENIDVNTGALEPAKQALAAFGAAVGVDTSGLANVSAGESFNSVAAKMVLSAKASQKGPQTESDQKVIERTTAKLGNTKQGNQFIMDSARAINNRMIDRKTFYDKFIQDSGQKFTNEKGITADQAWFKFKARTPMVSPNLKNNGIPVFYFRYKQHLQDLNGGNLTEDQILTEWEKAHKRSK